MTAPPQIWVGDDGRSPIVEFDGGVPRPVDCPDCPCGCNPCGTGSLPLTIALTFPAGEGIYIGSDIGGSVDPDCADSIAGTYILSPFVMPSGDSLGSGGISLGETCVYSFEFENGEMLGDLHLKRVFYYFGYGLFISSVERYPYPDWPFSLEYYLEYGIAAEFCLVDSGASGRTSSVNAFGDGTGGWTCVPQYIDFEVNY